MKCRTINDVLIYKFEESGFYYYYSAKKNRRHPFLWCSVEKEIVAVGVGRAGVLRNIAPLFARVTRAVVYRAGSQESVVAS